MSSQAQMAANQANAQLSTGPKTADGKAKISLNAVKTGLTGRTVLLTGDDANAYRAHIARYQEKFSPVNTDESSLTQSLADTEWRLLRIPSLEMGIYAIGRLELADSFEHIADTDTRNSLIEAKIFLTYRRDLNNLSIQENRLRRQFEKDKAELTEMQQKRKETHDKQLNKAGSEYIYAIREKREFDQDRFGFEFSMEEIEYKANDINPQYGRKRARSSKVAA
jgi:hypothetical protein